MLSSDKNVETLARLIETLKDYIGLRTEYLKLDVVHKLVRLLTVILLGVILFVMLLGIFLFLSFAAVCWLAPHVGLGWAFVIVAGAILLLLLLVFALRRPLIVNPFVRLFAGILLSK